MPDIDRIDKSDQTAFPFRFAHLTEFPSEVMQQIETIYEVSFPHKERKPFWYVTNAMQQGHYSVFVIYQDREASSVIVAFGLLVSLPMSKAMYIEYLAVEKALRGQGIGSQLMRSIIAFLKDTPASAIVWEVDPPENSSGDNARRIRFYERLGAVLIEKSKHYAMPNYYRGSGTLPLRLMWQPLQPDRTQPTKAELIALITDIYAVEYGGQDTLRDKIIASLDEA